MFIQIELVTCRLDNRVYVRKSIEKAFALRTREQCSPQTERDLLLQARLTDSPWAPQLLAAYQMPTHLNLIMDYAEGGTLWDVLESSPYDGKILESDLRWWAPQVVSAIHWCHSQGFAHRDIKPHNFVLTKDSHILLLDFGSAAPLLPPGPDEILKAHEEALVALEMEDEDEATIARELKQDAEGYGVETDWWSLGAMLYEMIYGVAPFFANEIRHTYQRIMNHEKSLRFPADGGVSSELRDLLKGLLTHADQRLGRRNIMEITDHPFFEGVDWMALSTALAPSSLHLPQFTYSAPNPQANNLAQSNGHAESRQEESFSQGFAFSALFQSSRATSPGASFLRSSGTPNLRSSTRDDPNSSFIGFSWGPTIDAFQDLPETELPNINMTPAPLRTLSTHATPANNFLTPGYPHVLSTPAPNPLHYMTPTRGYSHSPMHTVLRTSTIRRTAPRRTITEREAMKQLVDCVGMSARKKVLESGRKPRILTSFTMRGNDTVSDKTATRPRSKTSTGTNGTLRKELRFDPTATPIPMPDYTASEPSIPKARLAPLILEPTSPVYPCSASDGTESEGPPSPSPTPRPGSAMSITISSRRSGTPTLATMSGITTLSSGRMRSASASSSTGFLAPLSATFLRPNSTGASASMTISKDPRYNVPSLKKMPSFFVDGEAESRVEMGRREEERNVNEELRKAQETDKGEAEQKQKQDDHRVESKEQAEDGLWDELAQRHKKIMADIGHLEERKIAFSITLTKPSPTPESSIKAPMTTLECYLVLGGAGFLGSHIVEALVARGEKNVISYDMAVPLEGDEVNGATYIKGDVLDEDHLYEVLQEHSITTVFHTVSPQHDSKRSVLLSINLAGTRTILNACRNAGVVTFVYTSSTGAVWSGQVVEGATEDDVKLVTKEFNTYGYTKALAEDMVIKANERDGMRTVAIRPCGMCGAREKGGMPRTAEALETNQHSYHMGNWSALNDVTYVGNVADAHLLAADKLAPNSPSRDEVSGEAFFVTDDRPQPSYVWAETAWTLMGADPDRKKVQIPGFIAWLIAAVSELVSLFTGKPPLFTLYSYRYLTTTQWYSCEKAKRMLGYKPRVSFEEGCGRMIEWWKEKELLSEILDNFYADEVHAFLTVSRSFYGACARSLYHTIKLEDIPKIQNVCETLAFNFTAAGYVRKLVLRPNQAISQASLPQFCRTLRSALRNIATGAVVLNLTIPGFDPSPHMKRMHCPALKALYIYCPITADIMSFILGHPHIKRLGLLGEFKLPEQSKKAKVYHRRMVVKMPSLAQFTGPFEAMSIFLPSSHATEVEVTYGPQNPNSPETEEILVELLTRTNMAVTSLGFMGFSGFRQTMFNQIGDRLTSLVKLSLPIQSLFLFNDPVILGLNVVLPHLSRLYHLHFYAHTDDFNPQTVTEFGLSHDHQKLTAWALLQDSLCICDMPSRLIWARLKKSGHWIPLTSTATTLKWWIKSTSLLPYLQENVVYTLMKSAELREAVAAKRVDDLDMAITRKVALAVGYVINRAFDLPPSSESYESEIPGVVEGTPLHLEQLLLPVRGPTGKMLASYSELPKRKFGLMNKPSRERWDMVLMMLGLASLYPIKTTMCDLGLANVYTHVGEVPVLEDVHREAFSTLLDVVYNTNEDSEGIRISDYLRNPEDHWGHLRLLAVFDENVLPPVELS
ncbi:hypothetical protein H1R20_g11396, partial [Candolleomyces eurysporus]